MSRAAHIALEVSSAARPGEYGGVPGAIRQLVFALAQVDPSTPYLLCSRLSRWRKGRVFVDPPPNARTRLLQDPFNAWLLRGARLLHSMGIFLPRTPGIPKLLTIHDLNAVRNTQWVSAHWHEHRSERIERALSRADHVVTYSSFTAGEVCEAYGIPAERVHPVLLGVDTQRFQPPPEGAIRTARAEHGDYVLAVGLQTPRKNFPRLVAAVAALPHLKLVLVGRPGDGTEALEDAISEHSMNDRVRLLRDVSHEDLVGLIGGARAFAVPSLYEGFGLTVLEAMACGTPVVCSDAASLPEVAGDAACMVDATRVDALGDGLRRVVESSELARDLAKRGLDRARSLSWSRSARSLRALYAEVGGV